MAKEIAQKLPFREQIAHTLQKAAVPVESYYDLPGETHDRAFMVIGLAKQDVLADVMNLTNKGIAEGMTLREFQKAFDQTIQDRWLADKSSEYRGWRARVIYETNTRTAYAAGRYKQLTEMRATHPYWQYKHSGSRNPRDEHIALHNKVIRADDPWWDTNYPPNGWGCKCYVRALTEGDMQREGLSVSGGLPNVAGEQWAHIPGMHTTHSPNTPQKGLPSYQKTKQEEEREALEKVPLPGFGSQDVMQALEPKQHYIGGMLWEQEAGSMFDEYRGISHEKDKEAKRQKSMAFVQKHVLGGESQKILDIECGKHFKDKIAVKALLGGHISKDPDRLKYLGYLPDMLQPQEIWGDFTVMAYKGTGGQTVRPRHGALRLVFTAITSVYNPLEKKTQWLVMFYQNNGMGELELYTFYPVSDPHKFRVGRLLAKKHD